MQDIASPSYFSALVFLCGANCFHLIISSEFDFSYFKMNEALFSLFISAGLIADSLLCNSCKVFSDLSLPSKSFDSNDFEVTSNLKTALGFVCGGENFFTLSIVFKPEVKKTPKKKGGPSATIRSHLFYLCETL